METKNQIPEIECNTAEQLLCKLDETRSCWRGSTWIFRGQNNAVWPLHPRAMRGCSIIDKFVEDNFEKRYNQLLQLLCDKPLRQSIESNFEKQYSRLLSYEPLRQLIASKAEKLNNQVSHDELLRRFRELKWDEYLQNFVSSILHSNAERFIVRAFAERADQAGLRIPKDRFANMWDRPFTFSDQLTEGLTRDVEPTTDEYVSIIYALAQHHRIPTRLLDWTYRPLVAAFFAAHTDKKPKEEPCRIVVWAVKQKSLSSTGLRVIKHRRSDIGFLQSQDGLFLYDTYAENKFLLSKKWFPFDLDLGEITEQKAVYKLTLPYSEKDELLELLQLKRVSKPFLMPSFDNVAEEIKQKQIDWMLQILG